MAKVLKVTKPDKTVHIVPLDNKAKLQHLNNLPGVTEKMKLEEIDEKDAKGHNMFDESFATGQEAQEKYEDAQKEIEALKAKLAQAEADKAAAAQAPPSATTVDSGLDLSNKLKPGPENKLDPSSAQSESSASQTKDAKK